MRSLNIAAQNSGKWTPPSRTRSSLSTSSSSTSSPIPSWRAAAKSPTTKSPPSPTTQEEEPEFSLSELVVSSEKSSSTNSNPLHESSCQLFDSKTEIEYLDNQDDLAARVYGDRGKPSSSKNSTSNDSSAALGTSGYNFDSLLSS